MSRSFKDIFKFKTSGAAVSADDFDNNMQFIVDETSESLVYKKKSGSVVSLTGANKNYIINGNFDISQRGLTVNPSSSGNQGLADRFFGARSGGALNYSGTKQNPTGLENIYKTQRTAGDTSSESIAIAQVLDSDNVTQALTGNTATISGKVQHGSTYSSTAGVKIRIYCGTVANDVVSPFVGFSTGNQLLAEVQTSIS
jgi:hypothetical protein